MKPQLLLFVLVVFVGGRVPLDGAAAPIDPALRSADVVSAPDARYKAAGRLFQGIPGIARAPGGRLWATWYGGGSDEGPENYMML